jgi:hypothetical protein
MSNIVLRNSRAGWVSITGIIEGGEVKNQRRLFLEQPGAPGFDG